MGREPRIYRSAGIEEHLSPFLRVLRKRQVRLVITATFINSLAFGLPLAMILLVAKETDSFASAGVVVASFTFAGGLLTPLRGAVVDKRGQGPVLVKFGVLHGGFLIALLFLAAHHSGLPILAICGGIAGAATAPIGPSLRVLWSGLIEPEELSTGYALQAILNEAASVVAPLLTGVLVAIASPSAAFVVLVAAEFAGVILFAMSPVSRAWSSARPRVGGEGATVRWLWRLAVVTLPFGIAIGGLEAAVPAFAVEGGSAAVAGPAFMAMAGGSIVGGLVYGSRTWSSLPAVRLSWLLGLSTAAFAALLLAQDPIALVTLMLLVGGPVAAVVATLYALLDILAPDEVPTTATGWLFTAYAAGASIGTVIAGFLVQSAGVTVALSVSTAGAVSAWAMSRVAFSSLQADPGQGAGRLPAG